MDEDKGYYYRIKQNVKRVLEVVGNVDGENVTNKVIRTEHNNSN